MVQVQISPHLPLTPENMYNQKPKHIILVVLDSMRADHMSCYGYDKNTTPFLSSMLKTQGVLFANAYSASSWTLPSVSSLLTGTLPSCHHRVDPVRGPWDTRVPPIPALLQAFGFYSELISANGFFVTKKYGFDKGFHRFTYVPSFSDLSKARRLWRAIRTGFQGLDQGGPGVVRTFQQRIVSQNLPPSFFCLHFNDTHSNFNVPRSFIENANQRKLSWRELLRAQPLEQKRKTAIARYDGAILFSDYLLGNLVRFLMEKNLWEDTLLVVTSDHGEMLGENGDQWGHGAGLCESLLRVPLILLCPQLFPKPNRISQVVQTVDIVPTVGDILDTDFLSAVDQRLKGVSLLKVSSQPAMFSKRIAFSEVWRRNDGWLRSAIDGRCQVIWEGKHDPEIIDLVADPFNRSNTAGRVSDEQVRHLISEIAHLAELENGFALEELDEQEIMKRLRDLGYEGV